MLIAEIFHSVQGEGKLIGMPSVFIRTSGCNLRCVWCDTPYASWNPEGQEWSEAEILAEVARFPTRYVVVTGGEPMIARGMPSLLYALRVRGYHITLETAATVPPRGVPCDLASLSPKLAHSTPSVEQAGAWAARHEQTRLRPEIIREWMEQGDYQLKFVVREEGDLNEIHALLDTLRASGPVPPENVLLMPEGTDEATLRSRGPWLAEICKQTGFRFCPRLHVALYGNLRGT